MKVKLKDIGEFYGTLKNGDIVDVAINPVNDEAYVFDSTGCGWFIGTAMFEPIITDGHEANNPMVMNIKDMLGAKSMTVEF